MEIKEKSPFQFWRDSVMKPQVNFCESYSPIRGIFSMVVRNARTGAIIERYEDHNLIVTNARELLARLLAGDTEGHSIASIAFGTNGADATVDDTRITNAFVKAVNGFDYPSQTSARFSWNLLVTENNGMAIREFGLLSADGTLFARRTRQVPLNKAEDISIEGTWTIQF
jgi:hypothetical protein